MQFVKTHWISLLSGLVGLLAIALAIVGMLSDSVIQELSKRRQIAAEISKFKSDPQNEATINAEKERGRRFAEEYEKVVRAAEAIN